MGAMSGAAIRAILFTDMASSTELRSTLGEAAADALRRDHDGLLGAVVAELGGRVLRWTGDGLKAEFALASTATTAAIQMQRAVAKYSRSASAVAAFRIRIGIAVGEVTEEDGDLHGVAVVEAARLEAMAAPGEILATDLVERLGRRRSDAAYDELGPRELKGLNQPVHVVRVVDQAADASLPAVPMALAPDRRFPLVGRMQALATAGAAWQRACGGDTTTVLLAGQPGIGKSRLIAQMAEAAHADGALVLAGVCDKELSRPYQPFAAAFGDVHTLDTDLAAAVTSGAGSLGPLFPARRATRADDGGATTRLELFDAVVELLHRLATDQPVLLVVEDLQWATAPTVQLLRHLVHEATDTRLLVVASYRVDDVVPSHPMHDALADIRSSGSSCKIDLAALDAADIAELIDARVPGAPPSHVQRFAQRVCDDSAGNPFFACELLHHLATTGQLERLADGGDVSQLAVPDSVREVVEQRLRQLVPEAGDLLSWAATIGMSFDLDVLAALVDRPLEEVLGLVESLARLAMVQETSAGRFSFAHAILRTTLTDAVSATRRALMHRRVAECIEALRRTDHDALAHHWAAAGVEAKANEQLELAARRDLEALAYESALDRYQQLVSYHRGSSADAAALARAHLGAGLARRALGTPDYLLAVVEAGRIARRLHDADLTVEAALASVWPGTYFHTAGLVDAGLVELSEDALQAIAADDPRRARLLATLASHLSFDHDRSRRAALIEQAHVDARRAGEPHLVGTVLVAEHLVLWDPLSFDRRAEIARELARCARATGDAEHAFFAGFFAAFGAIERADVVTGRRQLAALDEPIQAARNFYFEFLRERLLISLDILQCRDGVQAQIDAVPQRYVGTHADTIGTWSIQTAGLAIQRGEVGHLLPAMQRMVDAAELVPNWRAAYGLALLGAGDRAGAMAVLDEFEAPPMDYFWLTTMQAYSDLALALGRRDMMPGLYDALAPYRTHLGITATGSLCFGLIGNHLGDLALAMGDMALATEVLEEAAAAADAMAAPFEQARSRRALATAMRATGRTTEADAAEAAALTLIDRHGFEGERRRLRPTEPQQETE